MTSPETKIAQRLIPQIEHLYQQALALERTHQADLDEIPEDYQDSGRNLLHYLALRQGDLRELQDELTQLGASSLGRLEPYALRTLEAVLGVLHALAGEPWSRKEPRPPVSFRTGPLLLEEQAEKLFGPKPGKRPQRIMVTLPSEAATDPILIERLVAANTNLIRINCAHDGPDAWLAMIDNLRRAEKKLGRKCRIYADLDGPKLRTGAAEGGGEPLLLHRGDEFMLVRSAEQAEDGAEVGVRRLPCQLEQVFDMVRAGERVCFDDGKIAGQVVAVGDDCIRVRILEAKEKGSRLKLEKGINLPDTRIELPALNDKDIADLEALAPHIDVIGMSFVRRPEDVLALHDEFKRLNAAHIGVVLKIENREALEALPHLLLTALRSPPVGIMVARGDLAAEVGFERLAEAQEEILWFCEAAHVPVIWATQVLESMAKTGLPSRAEVTDAAMSQRAECVMLNKDPHIVETVKFLDDILERMQTHYHKKRATLRKLSLSKI